SCAKPGRGAPSLQQRPLPCCLAGAGPFAFPCKGRDTMLNLLGLCGLGYLAAAGVATNAAGVGRGLGAGARRAARGDPRGAAVEALGAVVAPVALTYVATASLVMEVVGGAGGLVRPVLGEADLEGPERQAA